MVAFGVKRACITVWLFSAPGVALVAHVVRAFLAERSVTRGAGSGPHLAVLQEGRENANIDAGLGFIWRISGEVGEPTVSGPAISE